MKKYFVIYFLLICQVTLSQNRKPDSTFKKSPDYIKIRNSVLLSDNSEVFRYDSLYIWNDKRNLSEIMDERPGYFVFDFGLGGRNDINYNSKFSREVGIFRDGIQLNDNFFQGFDIQNLSVNEIEKIEEISNTSSFFYGINSFAKSINVISKDVFNTKPFSQLRYSQDREGSLVADFYYSQPVTKNLNVQLGITKHSMDGRYENSGFNVWRGRSRINLYLSSKLNFKLNFYLNNWERGLNDGLIFASSKDSLLDPTLAEVVHPSTKEDLENYYYDFNLAARLFKNENSLTKFKFYSINSLRNLDNPDSIFRYSNLPSGFNHSIQYAAELLQNIYIKHNSTSNSNIVFGGNFYYNTFNGNHFDKYNDRYISVRLKYDINFNKFFASSFMRNDIISNNNYFNYGIESSYKIITSEDLDFILNVGFNETKYLMRNETVFRLYTTEEKALLSIPRQYYESGGSIRYKSFTLNGNLFGFSYDNTYDSQFGINGDINLSTRYFWGNLSVNYSQDALFPQYYLKSDLSYVNVLFRGKLKVRTGFNFKYYRTNYITNQYQTWYSFNNNFETFPQKDQFAADFYVGARIGRANINLTLANIFNSLVYNSYIFPLDDRGGFLNSISRFTIVWDFIN